MKKITFLCLAITTTFCVRAQIQFGVKAGINLSKYTFSGNTAQGLQNITNFNAGVLADIPLFSKFLLQPEIMYSGEGFEQTIIIVGTGKVNTGNINIPVLFKYQHSSGLFAETGPQIGFIISAKQNLNGQSRDLTGYTTSDFSWVFGLGYKLPFNLGIDARYNLGVTDILGNGLSPFKAKSEVFQIGLFYLFRK